MTRILFFIAVAGSAMPVYAMVRDLGYLAPAEYRLEVGML